MVAAQAYVLDTSAYSAFNRKDSRLKPWFKSNLQIIVPLIVVAELRAGFAFGGRQAENETLLQHFLDAPNVTTIGISNATTKLFAAVFASLRRAGTPIGSNDMWIAAIALEHDLQLLTLDSDFGRVPDLMLVNV